VYDNGNIDLMKQNDFVNMPDIKNLNSTGSKRINSVYFKNKLMYLCTDFGIVVLNPEKREINESYVLQQASKILKIKALTSFNGNFYAATDNGVYMAAENNPALQNFANWTAISTSAVDYIFTHQGTLFCASSNTVFTLSGTTLTPVYSALAPIQQIRAGITDLYVCERDDNRRAIMTLDQDGLVTDSVFNINPNDVVETDPNEIWEADQWEGLIKLSARKDKSLFNPNGVFSTSFYKLSVFNDDIVDGTTYTVQVEPGINRNDPPEFEENFFKKSDTVTLKICNIDRATYNFWNTWEFAQQSIGNPFSQPNKVIGNISNGALGAFCGYASWYKTIVVE
jgi:hypothetical protein